MKHKNGFARVIAKIGGPDIQQESDDWIKNNNDYPLKISEVAVTSSGNLNSKYLFHVNVPAYADKFL
jgi:O-acetyl-ADP-ribose deacetylase